MRWDEKKFKLDGSSFWYDLRKEYPGFMHQVQGDKNDLDSFLTTLKTAISFTGIGLLLRYKKNSVWKSRYSFRKHFPVIPCFL